MEYDVYNRTTDSVHKHKVDDLWTRLMDNGHIYKGAHEGWYCKSDEAFLKSREEVVEKEGKTYRLEHPQQEVEWVSEPNYMFRMSAFEGPLLDWILATNPIHPATRQAQVIKEIQAGLHDISISRPRTRVQWGLPVRGDHEQSVYVWFDALCNYFTEEGNDTQQEFHHIVGKDILRFHALYWPAFLMAAGFQPPLKILAHAHWLVDKTKMSKSIGNVVCPNGINSSFGNQALRYFLLRDGGLAQDGDFSVDRLIERVNKDVADTMGNLLARATGKALLPGRAWPEERGADLKETWDLVVDKSIGHYAELDFQNGIDEVMGGLREANRGK